MNKYFAEFIGTFVLALAVSVSLAGTFPVPTPVIAGLALGYGVYAMGGVSGAHFNPAITLGLLSIRKISPHDAAMYIAMQLIGASLATIVAKQYIVVPALPVLDNPMVMLGEGLGTFVFAFGVAAVAKGQVSQGASGLAVGGSLLLGLLIASPASNAVLNPAVALAIGSFSLSYFVGPILGAIIAMLLYKGSIMSDCCKKGSCC
jgi:glycerol uptake facilitator-like aquaporin